MSGMKTVTEQLKDALSDKDALTAQVATLTAERDQARTDLSAATQNNTTLQADLASAREALAKAEADKKTAEDRAQTEATRADAEKVRAEKAEKKLALDPGHIEVSGRVTPAADGSASGGGSGPSMLQQYAAIKDRKEQRKFYSANKAAIEAEIRENKKG